MASLVTKKKLRVLAVDDQESMRSALQRTLSFEGFDVTTAGSGARALDLLSTTVFDLVLLDVNMPDVDGFAVLAKMRESAELASLPVILVTGVVSQASVMRGKELGVSDYLVKPYRIVDLLARIERCLGAQSNERLEDLVAIYDDTTLVGETPTTRLAGD